MIVTIPQRAVPALPWDLLAGVPADVVVVDTGNYYPSRDGHIDALRLKEALAAADRGRLAEYRGKADDAARAFFASQPQ